MKKKGFTLIELLAVIVVLAIIALIATPIVMNVIKNAQMGAAERSADNYLKAVETLIATEKLDGNKIADGSYTITSTGKLTIDGKEHEVEVSGTKPNGGTIKIENGQVVKNESSIKVGDYTVTYEDGVAKAEDGESKKLMTLADCDLEGGIANTIGAKYTCNLGDKDRTFYVLEAGTSSKPATLILEGNYDTETLAWCDQSESDDFSTTCTVIGANKKLDEIASVWTKLDRNQIGLPSVEQIFAADGQSEDAYLNHPDLNNEWLYAKTNNTESIGYWTNTVVDSSPDLVWFMYYNSNVGAVSHDWWGSDDYGVRPVITLSI